jgi:hypothetical protein
MQGSPGEVLPCSMIRCILAEYPGVPRRQANSTTPVIRIHGVTAWMASVGHSEVASP